VRVLFVAHSFPRHAEDDAGSFVLRLARALRDDGVEVEAIAPHAAGLAPYELLGGVPVHRYRYAPAARETLAYAGTMAEQVRGGAWGKVALAGLIAAGARATARRARAWRADLVHAHWWFPGGVSAAAACRVAGLPLVTTSHGSDVRLAGTLPGGRALLRAVVRRSAHVTAVSEWLAAEIRAAAPSARPTVAPMPADTTMFAPGGAPEVPRARLLFVGRLNEQKGLGELLRALARTRSVLPIDVVGQGRDEAALRALAASLGIADRVRWHGSLPARALAARYREAAAVVMPSREEGLGMVAVEAQLSGTPVVAFASGGLTDVIEDGRTGLLVRAGDVAGLADALDRIAADPTLAAALGAAGRGSALARFAPRAAAARYAAIYESAGASGRP
jgi:glycosyltransferase involved in cell wall biosynthesis